MFIEYWLARRGDETDSCVDRGGSLMFVDGVVRQVLDHADRTGYPGYVTGPAVERVAGRDTLVVLNDDRPSRLDQWLPWRETRPMSQWAPVVVMHPNRAPAVGQRIEWALCPTPLDGVYVRDYDARRPGGRPKS